MWLGLVLVVACRVFVEACELLVTACRIYFPCLGSNLGPLPWEHEVVATGLTEEFLWSYIFKTDISPEI